MSNGNQQKNSATVITADDMRRLHMITEREIELEYWKLLDKMVSDFCDSFLSGVMKEAVSMANGGYCSLSIYRLQRKPFRYDDDFNYLFLRSDRVHSDEEIESIVKHCKKYNFTSALTQTEVKMRIIDEINRRIKASGYDLERISLPGGEFIAMTW